jgi:transcriptional regulator with XRE-family HTH domain
MSKKRFVLPELVESKPQIGGFLRKLRNKFSLTQEFIAKKVGLSRPTLNKIEANKAELSLLQAKKLADFYNLPLADLLSGQDSMNSNVRLALKETGDKNGAVIVLPLQKYHLAKEVSVLLTTSLMGWPTISELSLQTILFNLEFAYWTKYQKPLLGLHYQKNSYGPTPLEWESIMTELINEKRIIRLDLPEFKFPRTKLISMSLPDLDLFKGSEFLFIEQFITSLSLMDLDGIKNLSEKIEQFQNTPVYQNIIIW